MQTFLRISLRHLSQGWRYSIINIVGLAAGITCMLLAVLYWKDEQSFDLFHKNNPHLYRILTNVVSKEGKTGTTGGTGQVQGPAFKAGVPEIKSYTRILGGDFLNDFASEGKSLRLQPLFVDSSFFNVFTFKLLQGNPNTVLDGINAVVLTESAARKFYNSTDVVGRLLEMDANPSFEKLGKPLIISGVVKDPPSNSSLQFDVLLTFDYLRLSFTDENWLNGYLGTFILLHPDADINKVLKKFNDIYKVHAGKQISNADFNIHGYDPKITYGLQPLTEWHFNPLGDITGNAKNGTSTSSNPVYSYMFIGISFFILLMASINFINISIANSLKRSKEVGIRKIAGGSRWQIIMQFLLESSILCCIAFLLSVILMNILLPLFNSITGKQLLFIQVIDARLLVYFLALLAVVVLLTSLYPAIILSNFRPSEVLYNKQKLSGRNLFGKSLVVLQFSLAIFLLIAAIVYYSQMNYMRTKDLGYNPNQVIRTEVGGDRDYKTVLGFLKNELAKEPSIKTVSFGSDGNNEEMHVNNKTVHAVFKNIDENFLPALEIPLKTGRNLSYSIPGDAINGAIVNEAFVKEAGIQDPIGKQVKIKINWGYDSTYKIIQGVVKDFHFGSLRESITPMLMYMNQSPDAGIWVKFERSKQKEALTAIERIFKLAMPGAVFRYNFLDELVAGQYLQEDRWQKIINTATIISLVVCCLGLFGLAHLSTSRRIKEIGIRKVLGATVAQIVTMLSSDFLKLVFISFLIAAPAAWIVMNKWLQDFAYRISIGPGVFLMAGLMAVITALMAISFQSVKTGIANPVNSLKKD